MSLMSKSRGFMLTVLALASPVVSASEMTLNEVFELYSEDTIRDAFLNNQISASVAENPEDIPLYVRYRAVFTQLLLSPEENQERFSEEDWNKILALPSHQHTKFSLPLYFMRQFDCKDIQAIADSGAVNRATLIAEILNAQAQASTDRLDKHYHDFLNTLSAEGKAQVESDHERLMQSEGNPISWSTKDNVGIAKEIPLYIETTALLHCHAVMGQEPEDWAINDTLLLDAINDYTPHIVREKLYTAIPQNPQFNGETLHIPLVQTELEGEVFQRAELNPVSDEVWELRSVRQSQHLINVESMGYSSFTASDQGVKQVLINLNGYFSSGCGAVGASVTGFDETTNTFEVDLYNRSSEMLPGEYACTGEVIYYSIYHPLPVYGLPAGDYQVLVNDEFRLNFSLENDNVHPDYSTSVVVKATNSGAILSGDTLQIPYIDMPDQAGRYQQVELSEADENLWHVSDIREGSLLENINHVELAEFGENTKQVLLNVKGNYSDGCHRPGNVITRFKSETNTLEVNFYQYLPSDTEISEGICAPGDDSFDLVYPLPVYAAPAGDYHVLVNGEHTLDFELTKHNVNSFTWSSFGSN